MTKISKEEAKSKLKEAKDNLDLELITKEEYEQLKENLGPMILGKSGSLDNDSTSKEQIKSDDSYEKWEQNEYSFDEWFGFLDPLNKLIKEGESKIKNDIMEFVKQNLKEKSLEYIQKKNKGEKFSYYGYATPNEIRSSLNSWFGKNDVFTLLEKALQKKNIKNSEAYFFHRSHVKREDYASEAVLKYGYAVTPVTYFCEEGVLYYDYFGDNDMLDPSFKSWSEFVDEAFKYDKVDGGYYLKEIMEGHTSKLNQELKLEIEDKIQIANSTFTKKLLLLEQNIDKKDYEDLIRLNRNLGKEIEDVKVCLEKYKELQVYEVAGFAYLINKDYKKLEPIIDKIKFVSNVLILRDLLMDYYYEEDKAKSYEIKLKIEETGLLNTTFEMNSLEKLDEITDAVTNMTEVLSSFMKQVIGNQENISGKIDSISNKMNYSLALQAVNTYQLHNISKKLD